MLCNLVVENYALISKLEIDFRQGLTIITGETGAGKSILLGALSLILGKRADTSVLLDKSRKCLVEGTFNIGPYGLSSFFNDAAIDYDDNTLIRREISAAGKSRAFINDTPVNLETLTELGRKLIDIHSQHQHLNLSDSIFQMKVIDSYARNQQRLAVYAAGYANYLEIKKQYARLLADADRMKADLDYFLFQFNQLDEAKLTEGEQEDLENEQSRLTHAEEIKTALAAGKQLLQGENEAILPLLKECLTVLTRIRKYLPDGETLSQRIESSYIDLKDLAHEIDQLNEQFDLDPDRLSLVNDRLNLLYNLEKKHNVTSVASLIQLRENLRTRMEEINSIDLNLDTLEKKLENEKILLKSLAGDLTAHRQQVIAAVEQKITDMLHEVGIPNAGFKVLMEELGDFTDNGLDRLQFLFSANKNMDPQDIARVASGGELSRLMLCIKSLMSDSNGLPTLIFDEIDTGVSGDIAERVGNIISRMSQRMQIINITHLPQVASKGDSHFLVFKTEEGAVAETRMKLLSPEERQLEIAKMLSGEEITHAALENARALLRN
jgi:DNA repair protein RecN (Recombination protein N)